MADSGWPGLAFLRPRLARRIGDRLGSGGSRPSLPSGTVYAIRRSICAGLAVCDRSRPEEVAAGPPRPMKPPRDLSLPKPSEPGLARRLGSTPPGSGPTARHCMATAPSCRAARALRAPSDRAIAWRRLLLSCCGRPGGAERPRAIAWRRRPLAVPRALRAPSRPGRASPRSRRAARGRLSLVEAWGRRAAMASVRAVHVWAPFGPCGGSPWPENPGCPVQKWA